MSSEARRSGGKMLYCDHPDRNGGDRSLEAKLGKVIAAYQTLKGARAFA